MSEWLLQAMLLERFGPRLTMAQLAGVLGVTSQSLYNMVSENRAPVRTYTDVGRRWADVRDVARHLEECRSRAR